MRMKKTLASVLAAGLAVSSLAVGVFADDDTVKTFDYEHLEANHIQFNYANEIRGNRMSLKFEDDTLYYFGFNVNMALNGGYKIPDGFTNADFQNGHYDYYNPIRPAGNPDGAAQYLEDQTLANAGTVKVTLVGTTIDQDGVEKTYRQVITAGNKLNANGDYVYYIKPVKDVDLIFDAGEFLWPEYETEVDTGKKDDEGNPIMEKKSMKVNLTSAKVEANFAFNTQKTDGTPFIFDLNGITPKVSAAAGNVAVDNLDGQNNTSGAWVLLPNGKGGNAKLNDVVFNGGKNPDGSIRLDNFFEKLIGSGVAGTGTSQYQNYNYGPILQAGVRTGIGTMANFKIWLNDNTVNKQGVKIKFYLADKNSSVVDAAAAGSMGYWADYLPLGATSGEVLKDFAVGVNEANSSYYQTNGLVDRDGDLWTIEFNYDDIRANVTSGDVQSIWARCADTVQIRKVDLIYTDAVEVDPMTGNTTSWDETVTEVIDENSGVKAEGTNKAITGNGGVILKATGTLTSTKLAYEVKLLNKDGVAVQPAGEITLTLPIPKDNQGKTIKGGTVAHTKGDGTVENLTILNDYKADGYVKVVTTSLSPFEMEFEEDETTTEAPETTTEAPETTTEAPVETTTEAPETTAAPATAGDKNANTGVAIAIVPAVIAAAGVIISKKRK